MELVGRPYFPYMANNEIFKNLLKNCPLDFNLISHECSFRKPISVPSKNFDPLEFFGAVQLM